MNATATTACMTTTISRGPAISVKVQSCILINDIARKAESAYSEMSVSDGARAGHGSFGKTNGTMLDNTMPMIRHGTKSGSFMPISVIGSCTRYPRITAILIQSRAYMM